MGASKISFSDWYSPKPKQLIAHQCKEPYVLFGGAMGGGKSWWLCAEAITNAIIYAGNRMVIVRETLAILRKTTMVTFAKVCPPSLLIGGKITNYEARFKNGSVIIFMGIDIGRDPTLQNLKGLEIGWGGIDEANETPQAVFDVMKSRLRWTLPNGKKPRYGICLTSNPESCWLKPVFINNQLPKHQFIQSLTTDNYDEDSEYVQTLREAFKGNKDLENRFLRGSWEDADADNQLIPTDAINRFFQPLQSNEWDEWCMAADIARFGDDRTVIPKFKGGALFGMDIHTKLRNNEVADLLIEAMIQHGISDNRVGVDAVGMGSGVVDSLFEKGYSVYEIKSGDIPDDFDTAKTAFQGINKRTQMFWWLMEDMRDGVIGNGCVLPPNLQEELRIELAAIRYDFASDRRVKILPKAEIKKRLGRSPDLADALAYANYMRRRSNAAPEMTIFVGGN